jgi:hypothetical protein
LHDLLLGAAGVDDLCCAMFLLQLGDQLGQRALGQHGR